MEAFGSPAWPKSEVPGTEGRIKSSKSSANDAGGGPGGRYDDTTGEYAFWLKSVDRVL